MLHFYFFYDVTSLSACSGIKSEHLIVFVFILFFIFDSVLVFDAHFYILQCYFFYENYFNDQANFHSFFSHLDENQFVFGCFAFCSEFSCWH